MSLGLPPELQPSFSHVASPQDSLPSLSGTVRSEGYGPSGLLDGAVVEVRQGTRVRRFGVGTDGTYEFNGLRPGPAELIVFHIATYPFEMGVRLPARGQVELDLLLRYRVIPVVGLQIRAVPELNRPIDPIRRTDENRVASDSEPSTRRQDWLSPA